ncbi:MAG: Phosphatidylglycerophosphatase A [Flavobacteriales bacterium]|nr:Phosphatidylglycerophosphatase A [Flavobacteriales bacterium]
MRIIYKIIASFFGTGYSPFAPGTAGALLAAAIYVLFQHFQIVIDNHFVFIALIFLTTLIGIFSANKLTTEWGKDPSKVVIDEAVGMWITMLFVPFSFLNLVIGITLFRLFDIFKPLGIRNLEKLNGGLGIMADDVLAGIYANVVLQIIVLLV